MIALEIPSFRAHGLALFLHRRGRMTILDVRSLKAVTGGSYGSDLGDGFRKSLEEMPRSPTGPDPCGPRKGLQFVPGEGMVCRPIRKR